MTEPPATPAPERSAARPAELAVVIPSVSGWADLEDCLAALAGERDGVALEVLVVDRCGEAVRARVGRRFPWVEVIAAPAEASIPELRALGFDRATAPAVAVIEDHVLVPPGWARAMADAAGEAPVVGGGVRNAATDRWVDWAAFLGEYSHLMPPLRAGPVDSLTGNNTVYDRLLLARHRDLTHARRWENHLHDRLRAEGIDLVCRPEIVVAHRRRGTVAGYLAQRYLYARSYAAARVEGAVGLRRLGYGLAALALPPVLLGRVLRRCLSKPLARWIVWRSVPFLALFAGAWGAGEAAGAWFGPGDAWRKVR